jgi:hypothetical protein
MRRRGCTPDSITTNKRTLQRFARALASNDEVIKLSSVTPERVKDYVTQPQTRECKWENHPN